MLVLTRRLKESIMIGNDIEIEILSIDGEQVKLGIHAPKNIDIHRKEVYISIHDANDLAAKSNISSQALDQLRTFKKK